MKFFEYLEKQLSNQENNEKLYAINNYDLNVDKYSSKQVDFYLEHLGQKNYKSKNLENKKELLGALFK